MPASVYSRFEGSNPSLSVPWTRSVPGLSLIEKRQNPRMSLKKKQVPHQNPRSPVSQYGQGKGEISAPLPEGKQDPSPPLSPLTLVAGSTYWAFGAE